MNPDEAAGNAQDSGLSRQRVCHPTPCRAVLKPPRAPIILFRRSARRASHECQPVGFRSSPTGSEADSDLTAADRIAGLGLAGTQAAVTGLIFNLA
eukprot:763187-Hanusia_phi.AAC.3